MDAIGFGRKALGRVTLGSVVAMMALLMGIMTIHLPILLLSIPFLSFETLPVERFRDVPAMVLVVFFAMGFSGLAFGMIVNGDKFQRLWEGDLERISQYRSQTEVSFLLDAVCQCFGVLLGQIAFISAFDLSESLASVGQLAPSLILIAFGRVFLCSIALGTLWKLLAKFKKTSGALA